MDDLFRAFREMTNRLRSTLSIAKEQPNWLLLQEWDIFLGRRIVLENLQTVWSSRTQEVKAQNPIEIMCLKYLPGIQQRE